MKFNNKVLEMWLKWGAGIAFGAASVIGKVPVDYTSADWKHILNSLWMALIPVVLAWANPKHDLTMTVKK